MTCFFHRCLMAALLLIAGSITAQTSTLSTVQNNGTRSTRVNIVFLSEGYTSAEMGTFASDVQTAINFLFTREPWNRYQSYCNVFRIEIASNQSGTDNGSAGGSRDTYFGTGFNIPGIPQNNTISSTGSTRAYSLLNKHVPEYDIPVVLVNDSKYGGSGGPLAVVTTNFFSPQILEHELGHSFAKLTDEYDEAYAGYPPSEFPNATTKTTLSQIRWKDWIEQGTALPTAEGDSFSGYSLQVGLYEGANYRSTGWYRPHDNALMRNLNREPGSVTREALILSYYGKVGMIDAAAPSATTLTHTTQVPLTFGLTLKSPSISPALTVEWRVDNVLQSETSATFNVQSRDIGNGTHTVKAIVRDPTPWVRRDPGALMAEEKTWTLKLSNQTDPPVINTPLPASRVLPSLQTLQLDATASGPGPITYQWLKNNVPLKPAVTTPTLTAGPVTLASAGTYTVRIINPGHTVSHSCKLAVVDTSNLVSKVVVGLGRTASLTFSASSNLPPVSWYFAGSGSPLTNGVHYANATTRTLQIKNVTTADTGSYTFTSGDYTTSPAIALQVVTDKPDYTGQSLSLPTGIVAARYTQNVPLPANVLLTPNSYTASKLPRGLSLHPKSGLISGIPSVASVDQTLGDEVAFTVGNEFGKVLLKIRLLIKPLPPGVAGSFAGPVYLNSPLGSTTGGRMSVNVSSTGAYTGSAVIGTETLPFKGSLFTILPTDTTASGSFPLKPKHLSQALPILFTVNNASDVDDTTANFTDGSNFSLWRNRWVPPEAMDLYAGYHTFGLTETTGNTAPKGFGFGSVTIDSTGKTTTTGKLADGSSFATTAHLSPEGGILVYQTLYATIAKGSFIAILDLTEGPPPLFSPSSTSNWFRPADTRASHIARTYSAGFGPESLLAVGGLYTAPAKTVIPMDLSAATGTPPMNAKLTFQQTLGDDPLAVNADVTLNVKPGGAATVNVPNPKSVTFKLTPADGRFSGSYVTKDADPRPPVPPSIAPRPAITRKATYQGIIIRNAGALGGYGFIQRPALPKSDGSTTPTTSPIHSGPVIFSPP